MSDAQAFKQEIWCKLGLDLFCGVNELFNKIENSDDMEIVYSPNTDVDGETCDGIFMYSKISHSGSDKREVKGWHIRRNDPMPNYYLNNLNHSADSDIVVCKYDYIYKR